MTRRFVALALVAVLVACNGSQPDTVTARLPVELSATTVAAPIDQRTTGGPRPDVDTSVLGATTTQPFSVAAAGVETEFVNATNWARRQVGVPELARDPLLDGYAREHAARMAAAGHIYHFDIRTLLGAWWFVGENVGTGPNAGVIQLSYYASYGHFRNLTHETYTHFGVGVFIDAAGRVWAVQDFAA